MGSFDGNDDWWISRERLNAAVMGGAGPGSPTRYSIRGLHLPANTLKGFITIPGKRTN